MRNPQPLAHSSLRLSPTECYGGDVLDRLGYSDLGRLWSPSSANSASSAVVAAADLTFLLHAPRHHARPQARRRRQHL